MHHFHRRRLRRPLTALALAALVSLAAQGSETPVATEAAAAGSIVGAGIGYGVDADRPRSRVVAQTTPAPTSLTSRERASPTSTDDVESSSSWLSFTHTGYAGLNIGHTAWGERCGAGGDGCKQARPSLHVYTGGMFNHFIGLELGYRFLGRAERGGGRTEAQTLGLGLRGRVAAGPWHLFVKAGLDHAQSRFSASPASSLPSGSARGWGGSYGAGVGWDMTPTAALVLEWASVELPGAGRQAVDNTSIGFVHHF